VIDYDLVVWSASDVHCALEIVLLLRPGPIDQHGQMLWRPRNDTRALDRRARRRWTKG